MEPMDHNGSSPSYHPSSGHAPSRADPAAAATPTSPARTPKPLALHNNVEAAAAAGPSGITQRPITPRHRAGSHDEDIRHILCPVVGCPESLTLYVFFYRDNG